MIESTNLNRNASGIPVFFSGTRGLGTVVALDEQLTTQKKAREKERSAFQQDAFVRSRELEAILARRQA
jgi:hypothetical protein